ncbi:MAG: T9SS type A sorting domain-containing protein [Cyclobacteriaceae bacterium]|nr:T9SS type A sorting domain-containing protein [Cyclobacteriaceae bacterium]
MKFIVRLFIINFLLFIVVNNLHAQTTFTSIESGDLNHGHTYGNTNPGVEGIDYPAPTDNLVVSSGTTVTLSSTETINNLTVDTGGVFDDNNKGDITVNGNLLLNGIYAGNRSIVITGGVGQTIDGTGVNNSPAGLAIEADATILASANLTIINNIDMSGSITVTNYGNIIINQDLKGSSATWVNADNSTLKIANNLLNGGGTLTASATGNTVIYNKDGGQATKLPTGSTYYNLIIEGTGAKTTPGNLIISGSLTITSGELDTGADNLSIAGDFTNTGGLFTENSNLVTFNGAGAQTITSFIDETFFDFTLNKTSGTLTLASNVIVSNILTFTSGVIDAGANKLTLGTGTGVEGTLTYTSGQIIGLFERWVANSTTGVGINFPVGTASSPRMATITFAGITTGGTLLFQFIESSPGNAGLSLVDGAATIYNTFADGYWDMSIANGFNLGLTNTFDLDLSGTGFTAFPITATTRLLTRANSGSNWIAEGTHATVASPIAQRTGLSTMGAQYAFGDDTNCTAPTTPTISGNTEVCTSDTGSAYTVIGADTYTWTIIGGTLITGQGTNSITVDWGSTGQVGSVSVVASNGCTIGATQTLSVNINSIAPTAIAGKIYVSELTLGEAYSVTAQTGYIYTWTITGGTQASGGTTNSITVDWGTAGVGNVSVVAQKTGCAAAPAFSIDVIKYIIINSAQTGDWSTGSTWVTGLVPGTTESARILNTHVVTLTGDETIKNIVIDAGGTVTTTNRILNVNGDITVNGTYLGGTKSLDIQGSNTTLDGTGTIAVTGNDINIINGNKTIATTAVLHITAGDFNINDASIIITNNGSISITDNLIDKDATNTWTNTIHSILKVGGTLFANGGTLNASSSSNIVEYNGAGAQAIITPSSSIYYNLTASTSGIKTVAAPLDINGTVTIDGTSTLDVNGFDLTVAGNWANNGTFTAGVTPGAQTVTLDGAAAQTISGTSTTTFNNLIINNTSGGVTTAAPAIIGGAITFTSGIVTSDATNFITVNSGGTSTGGNALSYVDGPMKKIGNTDFGFPTGDGAFWAPVDVTTIVGGSATTEFTAQYFDIAAPFPANLPASGLDHVSGTEYWEVANNTVDVTSADLTFYWKDAERSVITDLTTGVGQDLVAVHYNSITPEWEVLPTTITPGSTTGVGGTGSITATFTSFSPVGFGSALGLNALPIELVSFDGKLGNDEIVLTWVTASEINNDYFSIERSFNGQNFEQVAIVDGAGNSSESITYSAIDAHPYIGKSYYRLMQTDFDGAFSYSKVIMVEYDVFGSYEVQVYPNPSDNNKFTIGFSRFPIDKNVVITLTDALGRMVYTHKVEVSELSSGKIEIDPDVVRTGMFILSVTSGSIQVKKRIIITD